jgi:hypothetical protein
MSMLIYSGSTVEIINGIKTIQRRKMSIQNQIPAQTDATAKVKAIRATRWILITGILTIIIGLIHEAAAPIIFKGQSNRAIDIYMFLATGASVVFMGALIVHGSRRLKLSEHSAWAPTFAAGVYLLLLGIGAIAIMPLNPFSYLTMIVSLLELIPLWLCRREFL